jgi:hypothetical protein
VLPPALRDELCDLLGPRRVPAELQDVPARPRRVAERGRPRGPDFDIPPVVRDREANGPARVDAVSRRVEQHAVRAPAERDDQRVQRDDHEHRAEQAASPSRHGRAL